MPHRLFRTRPLACLGALLLLATCSKNSTTPTGTTTAGELTTPTTDSADVQSVDTAFKSPILTSFSTLAGSFIPSSPRLGAVVSASAPAPLAKRASYGLAARRLLALSASGA